MDEIKIAAAYIRVSTDDQVELSPASQLTEIRKWAKTNGYIVPDEYVYADEGISGRKVVGRDEFRRMIGVAKTKPKPFDAILLWKFSRFARNRDDAVFYKSVLRKQLGIEVISISEPMADGKMGIIVEALIEAMDEYYSINLSEEVKRGMTEKHRRGELQATPAYGYRVEDNILVPVEPEATYVKEIYRRFLDGQGTYGIAKWLNSIGARTHRGNTFANRTVEYMIRNPVYIGKLRWNPKHRTREYYHDPDVVIVDSSHEPLIENDIWEAAQRRISELKALRPYKGKPAEVQKDWVTGLVRCAACGAILIFAKPHYYKCNNYVRGKCTTAQHIRDDLLKQAIISKLQNDVASSKLAFSILRMSAQSDSAKSALTSSLAALNRKMERIREAYLSGADTVDEYKEAKSALQRQKEELQEQLSALDAQKTPKASMNLMRQAIMASLETLLSSTATTAQKYDAAHNVIDKAVFNKAENALDLYYRLIV